VGERPHPHHVRATVHWSKACETERRTITVWLLPPVQVAAFRQRLNPKERIDRSTPKCCWVPLRLNPDDPELGEMQLVLGFVWEGFTSGFRWSPPKRLFCNRLRVWSRSWNQRLGGLHVKPWSRSWSPPKSRAKRGRSYIRELSEMLVGTVHWNYDTVVCNIAMDWIQLFDGLMKKTILNLVDQ